MFAWRLGLPNRNSPAALFSRAPDFRLLPFRPLGHRTPAFSCPSSFRTSLQEPLASPPAAGYSVHGGAGPFYWQPDCGLPNWSGAPGTAPLRTPQAYSAVPDAGLAAFPSGAGLAFAQAGRLFSPRKDTSKFWPMELAAKIIIGKEKKLLKSLDNGI